MVDYQAIVEKILNKYKKSNPTFCEDLNDVLIGWGNSFEGLCGAIILMYTENGLILKKELSKLGYKSEIDEWLKKDRERRLDRFKKDAKGVNLCSCFDGPCTC